MKQIIDDLREDFRVSVGLFSFFVLVNILLLLSLLEVTTRVP